MINIKYKYICWIFKKMRTYAAALTPPPPVYAMRTHRPRPPPSPPCVRTLWMTPRQVYDDSFVSGQDYSWEHVIFAFKVKWWCYLKKHTGWEMMFRAHSKCIPNQEVTFIERLAITTCYSCTFIELRLFVRLCRIMRCFCSKRNGRFISLLCMCVTMDF